MDVVEKGPSPDKQQWRIVLARLEILLHLIQEFGINPKAWDWRIIFNKLVAPSFFNQNQDVRLVAIEVTLAMYKIVGNEVKQMVQDIDGMKPNIIQTIAKRMNQIDNGGQGALGGGKHYTGSILEANNRSGLEQIPEAHEEEADVRKSALSNLGGVSGAGKSQKPPESVANGAGGSQLSPQKSQGNLSPQKSQGNLTAQKSQGNLTAQKSQGNLQ